jgi:hypothetical protein
MTAVAVQGRPTKYHPELVQTVEQLPPMTLTQIAVALEITKSTLYEWIKIYPEFSDAVQNCRAQLVGQLEGNMLGQAAGTVTGNATAGIFMLKNLAPDEYRDRREHYVEVADTVEIEYIDHVGYEVLDEG